MAGSCASAVPGRSSPQARHGKRRKRNILGMLLTASATSSTLAFRLLHDPAQPLGEGIAPGRRTGAAADAVLGQRLLQHMQGLYPSRRNPDQELLVAD